HLALPHGAVEAANHPKVLTWANVPSLASAIMWQPVRLCLTCLSIDAKQKPLRARGKPSPERQTCRATKGAGSSPTSVGTTWLCPSPPAQTKVAPKGEAIIDAANVNSRKSG